MRMIVCGGRDYMDKERIFSTLDRVHAYKPISLLIEGGQSGPDTISGEWADARGVDHVTAHANWKAHKKAAGPRRNKLMLTLGAEGVVAFPGGRGTANMVRQAKEAGLPVMEVSS